MRIHTILYRSFHAGQTNSAQPHSNGWCESMQYSSCKSIQIVYAEAHSNANPHKTFNVYQSSQTVWKCRCVIMRSRSALAHFAECSDAAKLCFQFGLISQFRTRDAVAHSHANPYTDKSVKSKDLMRIDTHSHTVQKCVPMRSHSVIQWRTLRGAETLKSSRGKPWREGVCVIKRKWPKPDSHSLPSLL